LFAFDAQPFFFARVFMRALFIHTDGRIIAPMPEQRMRYWLMKSEPDEVSIDDVLAAPAHTVAWFGVRNYQARNFMRDQMQAGDLALFYHSSCAEPGIAGIVEIAGGAYPDATQFDPASHYYDPKATPEQPRWTSVDVKAVRKTPFVSLRQLRSIPELADMRLLAKGSRLSVMPVEPAEWRFLQKLLK
jgi:predicted RNA-binding protein with PUA-like domain